MGEFFENQIKHNPDQEEKTKQAKTKATKHK